MKPIILNKNPHNPLNDQSFGEMVKSPVSSEEDFTPRTAVHKPEAISFKEQEKVKGNCNCNLM
jgi:hypothetical protein